MNKTFVATDRETWRAWLAMHHASEREVWVLFAKKHSGQMCISYGDAVEEALCYGWIDSTVKRVDNQTYARKFTPRRDTANWSDLNKSRVEKCIREGRMTEVGLAKINYSNTEPRSRPTMSKNLSVPAFIEHGLRSEKQAWENFARMAPSHKRMYVLWISSAKREETRQRRLDEAIRMLMRNEKLGLK